ncbi:MAG: Holliday junction resolvase RuvX [Lachnospiraceae bacterium]|nr:Holliday junction resolvase RuvX [Lachnospiraceae bacterium]
MNKRKILGIDYGDFSIGLAIFDLEVDFIYPVKTIFRDKANVLRKSIREIVDIIKQKEVTDIVIGLPLNADGTEGERVEKVKNFAKMLKNGLNAISIEDEVKTEIVNKVQEFKNSNCFKISFQDERLTTVEAKTILAERGIKKEDWKKNIDQIAAEIILQDYRQANKI